ncbi:peptidase S8/S53 domain-containing protein [Mycotypha africana]|uniref:peptidase S8/S53 domain-containing protein n=1 Tax=Mycotypha africana TaxID=64632 RepID=UPI002301C769|nr:peptidase S8/S53 domain-containing protein [Mycotypha africana]KAI8967014.1 peptidase S8/S53 domain-containing protein [Mycotypha africana]
MGAEHIIQRLGGRFEGRIGELDHWFMMSTPQQQQSNNPMEKRASLMEEEEEEEEEEDFIVKQFKTLKRRSLRKRGDEDDSRFWKEANRLDKQILKKRIKRLPIIPANETLKDAQTALKIKDPWFPKQWHLINLENPGNDINVTGVWKQGITGKGVNVAILDDGLDYKSKDLADNFFAEGSYDFNDHESLPTPKLWDDSHGTRCAGQIAAVRNDVCGMGIAYEAKVAGVRILSGDLTDADEALALNYEYQQNHIFSCSWGPPDNGQTMEAPNGILADAFINGIEKGRDGKGSIYVFATGNGAISGDNCNFDGYTNSIYTITVGAIDHNNDHPSYSESCSAQLVVTYSSGGGNYIHTTDVGENSCSDRHGGTSAAAPNAAGIFALVLSVRPDLTWRDLQHLCVQTAVPVNTLDDDWKMLPSGRIYNHKFGYGKLDAYRLIEAAKNFILVNQQTWLELPSPFKKRAIPDSSGLKTRKALKNTVLVTEEMIQAAGLLRLEHITATVNIVHDRRGDLVVDLVSPNQVVSNLATRRHLDNDKSGMQNWKFMSVKHWEENPIGNWTLMVYDVANPETKGHMLNWTLTLYGEQDPAFVGEPIHSNEGLHDDKEHDIPDTTSISTSPPATTSMDDTPPSRPTRIKPGKTYTSGSITTTTIIASTSSDVASETDTSSSVDASQKEDEHRYLTVIYAILGSVAILSVASVMFIYQKKRSPQLSRSPLTSRRPMNTNSNGYEFEDLQPLTTELDEEDSEPDEDHTPQENNRLTRGVTSTDGIN